MNYKFIVNVDGQDKECEVLNPTQEQRTQAQIVYSSAISKALQAANKSNEKPLLRAQLGTVLQGIWTKEDEEVVKKLDDKLQSLILKLKKGGMKLEEGRKLALEIIDTRSEISQAQSKKNALDDATVEAIAEQAKFDYFVSECTVYKNGEKVFKDVDDYKNNNTEVAGKAATQMMALLYQVDPSYQESLPEYKFLKKYKFVDDKFRFINKEGKLTDRDGRLVNEDGRYINENGELINRSGQRVDEKGDLLVDFVEFEE